MEAKLNQEKEVKTVFCDFSADTFALADALVTNVNLYKKTNILEIFLKSKELISIKELQNFRKYIIKRFNIKDVNFKISNDVDSDSTLNFIENEWDDILGFLSQKKPILKAFMKESCIKPIDNNAENNEIEVDLVARGKELLEKQKVNEYISSFLNDVYCSNYKICFKL